MSLQSKKSLTGAAVLILLGTAAFFCDVKWLAVLIPLALLVYPSVGQSYGGKHSL